MNKIRLEKELKLHDIQTKKILSAYLNSLVKYKIKNQTEISEF